MDFYFLDLEDDMDYIYLELEKNIDIKYWRITRNMENLGIFNIYTEKVKITIEHSTNFTAYLLIDDIYGLNENGEDKYVITYHDKDELIKDCIDLHYMEDIEDYYCRKLL
jgi:hypothetical protein